MLDLRAVYVGLPLTAAAIFVSLGYLTWQRRHAPGARVFIYLALSLVVWSIGAAFETFSSDLPTAVFWAKFKYFGVVTMPPLWLIFALQYTGNTITRRTLALLAIHPVVTLALVWTTEANHLFWTDYRLDYSSSFPLFFASRGIGFWLHSAYSYTLTLIGTVLLLREAFRSLHLYRKQLLVLLLALLVPWVANVMTLLRLSLFPGLDPTPITFALTAAAVLWGLLRLKVLDIVPIARDTVIASMSDGLIVIDSEGRIVDLNPVAQRASRALESETIGRPISEVFGEYGDLIERYKDTLDAQAEVRIERDGVRHLDLRITPIKNRDGQLAGRLIVYRDITARKQVEEELEKRVYQLATLRQVDGDLSRKLDVQYVLAIALDFALRLTNASAGYIALAEEETLRVACLVGSYEELHPGSLIPTDKGIVGRVARQRRAECVSNVKTDPDYIAAIPETSALICIPLLSQERLIGILSLESAEASHFTAEVFESLKLVTVRVAVALDNANLYQVSQKQLAELQALYSKISHLEQLKTDMISVAAHDLSNPITIIMNYVWLLRESLEGQITEDQRFLLDSIEQASSRMRNITTEILSLDRIQRAAETSQTMDLCKLVEDVFQAYREQAKIKSQGFELTVSGTTQNVRGDAAQIREAMANLVSNAIKYTPDGGRIDVRLREVTTKAIFEVQDNGFGVPISQQDKLFKPFSRAATKETDNIEGVGLGLHLVKNIIERHHGSMIFRSIYGEGSTFGFELPAVPASLASNPESHITL